MVKCIKVSQPIVKRDDKIFAELQQACVPLQEFLSKHYNLECEAIVSIGRATILSTELRTELEFID